MSMVGAVLTLKRRGCDRWRIVGVVSARRWTPAAALVSRATWLFLSFLSSDLL